MPAGTIFPHERKFFNDHVTGVNIVKITSFPTVNIKLYFHVNAFTPDSQTFIFQVFKEAKRSSGIDIFKVNIDGTDLTQMTDSQEASSPVVSPDGQFIYYICQGELRRVSMTDCTEEIVNYIEGIAPSDGLSANTAGTTVNASMSPDGKVFITDCTLLDGSRAILRYTTDGKEADIIFKSHSITHTQIEPSEGKVIAFQYGPDEKNRNIWLIDSDGRNLRPLELRYGNGHWMWLGHTKRIISNMEKEIQGIYAMAEDETEPEVIAEGQHFWHSASSRDGKWIISDTNWPDNGLFLINVKTKKIAKLCSPDSSSCHPQWTHPHPSFSPDGKMVVYNSDVDGIPHIYLARIPEQLFDSLS